MTSLFDDFKFALKLQAELFETYFFVDNKRIVVHRRRELGLKPTTAIEKLEEQFVSSLEILEMAKGNEARAQSILALQEVAKRIELPPEEDDNEPNFKILP